MSLHPAFSFPSQVDKNRENIPVMSDISALPICRVSLKYDPRTLFPGVSPKEALNVTPVGSKVEDIAGSKVPAGHASGRHPEEFTAGSQRSLLPVSTVIENGCGGVPTVRLTT